VAPTLTAGLLVEIAWPPLPVKEDVCAYARLERQ
jgi:hypothetical protein